MKIKTIEIKNFRGFPGPAIYKFQLDGNNLLLYGENGSGKSSLFHALDQLFDADPSAKPFSEMAHLFAKDDSGNDITDGFVAVYLDDTPSTPLVWTQNAGRPSGDPLLADAALRKGFLDYRDLLRTSFGETDLDSRLFQLAVTVLLANVPGPPLAGMPWTLGDYWSIVAQPDNHHKGNLTRAESVINTFNQAIRAVLPDVEEKVSVLMDHFVGHHLKMHLEFEDLTYDRNRRSILNQKLHLRIEFNGRTIERHESILNEARLSAIALSLYLASVELSNPTPGPAVPSPIKLLVLDDVLIGLDLCNRLPLLDILDNHFTGYQVILSTYDRVWYDLVHLRTQPTGRWHYQEMFSDRIGDPGYDIPVLKPGDDLLVAARRHLSEHDRRAAAVYARAAFETRLKNYCDKKRMPVPYHRDPHGLSSDDLWKAVLGENGGDGRSHVDIATKGAIESSRKVVLNPLSHDDANSITKTEVQAAIDAVQELSFR